jgi:NADH:ubiquinone oxidoreductase subunit 6 (subunit J)
MTLQVILFYILALLTSISAIAVVVSQNIVRASIWLLFSLAAAAGLIFLLGADFVGATQVLVYVGGTLVLVVFGVMLTAQGPFVHMKISVGEWVLASTVGLLLFAVLAISLYSVTEPKDTRLYPTDRSAPRSLIGSRHLGAALLGDRNTTPEGYMTGAPGLEKRVRTPMHYLLPFEIVSVHLLVVLIGAAYLARAKRRRDSQSSAASPAAGQTQTSSPTS